MESMQSRSDGATRSTSSRRSFLKSSSLLVPAAGAAAFLPMFATRLRGSMFVTTDTTSGKLQGIDVYGIKRFLGIPYGASTSGKNRYMPPQKPAPWAGVRDAFEFGQIAPQAWADPRAEYPKAIDWDRQSGGMGEDCLALNVWTPGLKDGARRPVMVSFHGGGFATGSAGEPGYYGDPLARFGDVVVVTVNHRLASFGFLHVADLDAPPEFAKAGNAGMLDLVASLEWVRDNIENFGGDPNRVFIFGQSGGGAKTSVTMAMPAAKNLFHRAGVQSGSAIRVSTRENATKAAEKLIAKLGISKSRIPDLQKLSWEQILDAQNEVAGTGPGGSFAPVVDGSVLPQHPFDPVAPAVSENVPMIISTTLDDGALRLTNFDLDEAGLTAMVEKMVPGNADRVLKMYRKAYPDVAPFLIQARILTDRGRGNSYKQAERKVALGKAPAYMYLWKWPAKAFDGKFGAVHGTDVALAFHSAHGELTGDGPEARRLADELGGAWVAFARTGNPDNPALPHWPTYDSESRATMVFDKYTRVESDPLREFRLFWEELGTSQA